MFHKIFVEHQVAGHRETGRILAAFPRTPVQFIDKVEEVFERVRKPYLQKRTTLNLFVGRKAGQLVKAAPDAYGRSGEPHYYFIHAYNCIYECEYCYLQGYFNSPDLVLYVNHDEIIAEIRRVAATHPPGETVWFHAGEFSDSLALSHITLEWAQYWEAFESLPDARLELRTKAVNIRSIRSLPPLPNVVITFSLSPPDVARRYDRGTPSLMARLKALSALAQRGFRLGLHFDPIIYTENFLTQYRDLLTEILQRVPEAQIEYISLGVVRFSKNSYREFVRNYPRSELLSAEFVKSADGKVRYNRPMRLFILRNVQRLCGDAGVAPQKVYLCMEGEASGAQIFAADAGKSY